ncbi:MAG: OsmC family peroxiredoxin [Propionibacteriaceae bacterium]|nr:OsmC family peroxiredoxin [Propionibacteriaceae bacterium]
MSIAERTAETTWAGSLPAGSGTIHSTSSGALDGQPVTWASRTERPGGKTSPEELLAAAHSSCFSMALTAKLGERGVEPTELTVSATVTLDEVGGAPTITASKLSVKARVDGLDVAGFRAAVEEAAKLCPVSRLFAGAKVTVEAEELLP